MVVRSFVRSLIVRSFVAGLRRSVRSGRVGPGRSVGWSVGRSVGHSAQAQTPRIPLIPEVLIPNITRRFSGYCRTLPNMLAHLTAMAYMYVYAYRTPMDSSTGRCLYVSLPPHAYAHRSHLPPSGRVHPPIIYTPTPRAYDPSTGLRVSHTHTSRRPHTQCRDEI